MSEASLGPGWWQASDGRWYDPLLAPPDYAPPETVSGSGTLADAITFIAGAPRVQIVPDGPHSGRAPDGEPGLGVTFTRRGRPSMAVGWLGMALMGFVTLMAAALFILLIGVVIGGLLLALLIAATALGIHRLWLLTGGRYQARRGGPGSYPPIIDLIDVTPTAPVHEGQPMAIDGSLDADSPW